MKASLRTIAEKLRRQGWSYSIIAKRLDVSKSTLSSWLRYIPYKPNKSVKVRMNKGFARSAETRHMCRQRNISEMMEQGKVDIGTLSQRDLLLLGIGLYMGEGTKLYEITRFINSNPEYIACAMKWFREVCKIENQHFSVAVHLYPDSDERRAKRYWSKVTKVPLSQFERVQVDRRIAKSDKKKRKLPHGTAHITIRACGNKQLGVNLHRRIMGWIEAVIAQAGII